MREGRLGVPGESSVGNERALRPGDLVEVRPAAEILATLDEDGRLESVPFMPEMLQYVGRRFTVDRRVEKICDTISQTGSRRMEGTVYLEDLRCDGSGHDGCQAGCRIYWKEAWLRHVADGSAPTFDDAPVGAPELDQLTRRGARTLRVLDGATEEVWRCQATEALAATEPLKTSNPSQYWRELASGNVRVLHFLRAIASSAFFELAVRSGRKHRMPLLGTGDTPDRPPLDLSPGDVVRVRSPEEIRATLDSSGLNRGLSFDREMLPHCGRTYRVQARVRRIVDDRTGRIIDISRDCIILEGVVCSGERTVGCWFCPRAIYSYWREAWLERVEDRAHPARHDAGTTRPT